MYMEQAMVRRMIQDAKEHKIPLPSIDQMKLSLSTSRCSHSHYPFSSLVSSSLVSSCLITSYILFVNVQFVFEEFGPVDE